MTLCDRKKHSSYAMSKYKDLEKRRAYMRAYQKKKYDTDPLYKEKMKAAAKKRANDKYRNDPEHRLVCLARVKKRAQEKAAELKEYQKKYKERNRDKLRATNTEYKRNRYATDEAFREERKLDAREYYASPEGKAYFRNYQNEQRASDPLFKLAENLRRRVRASLKGENKSASTLELVGCSLEELKIHLEKLWAEGMSWDNYNYRGWHVDHVKPLAQFSLSDPEQQKAAFHFSNLQPLWREDNQSKGDSFPIDRPTKQEADEGMKSLAAMNSFDLWRQGAWTSRSEVPGKLNWYIDRDYTGMAASDHFHWASRMSCESLNSPSPIRSWYDPSIRATLENSVFFESDPALALAMRKYVPSQFRPSAAHAVFSAFESEVVFDPCAGWGDRMAAAISHPWVACYHCQDVNPLVFGGYMEQVQAYDVHGKVSMDFRQSELAPVDKLLADLVFTSPPYYKIEKYFGKLQSHLLYPKFDDWMKNFLFRMVTCAWINLQHYGHLVLNLSDCYADHTINRICEPLVKWATAALPDCTYVGAAGYRIAKRISKKKVDGVLCEPLLIFCKGESDWVSNMGDGPIPRVSPQKTPSTIQSPPTSHIE